MDDASSVFDASILTGPVANFPVADSFNRRLERDYSTGDIPHVFVASACGTSRGARTGASGVGVVGALVNDWTLTGVLTLQSGVPLAIAQTTNNNAFAGLRHAASQPDRAIRRCPPTSDRSSRWFNTSAFAAAPQFTIGTSSRNPVRGPGLSQSRPRADAPRAAAQPDKALEAARRGLQRDEHAAARRAEHHGRRRRPSARSRRPAIRASCSWR